MPENTLYRVTMPIAVSDGPDYLAADLLVTVYPDGTAQIAQRVNERWLPPTEMERLP